MSDRYGAVNHFAATKPDTRYTPQTSPCLLLPFAWHKF